MYRVWIGTSNGRLALAVEPGPLRATVKDALARKAPAKTWIWFLPRFSSGRSTCTCRDPVLSAVANCAVMSTPSSCAFMVVGSAPLLKLTVRVVGNDVTVDPSTGAAMVICGCGGVGGGAGVELLEPHACSRAHAPISSKYRKVRCMCSLLEIELANGAWGATGELGWDYIP